MLATARNTLFVLLGVAVLLLKGRYSGPSEDAVLSYGGNLAGSFAAYFVIAQLELRSRFRRLWTAGVALAVVELFEASNGFGVMTNVYDRNDFVANALGIALALAVDTAASEISRRRSNPGGSDPSGTKGRPAV